MAAGDLKISGTALLANLGAEVRMRIRVRVEASGPFNELHAKYIDKIFTWAEFVALTTAAERTALNSVKDKLMDAAKASPPTGLEAIADAIIE